MIEFIKAWSKKRQAVKRQKAIADAQKLLNSENISCVRLYRSAGTEYIQNEDGSLQRIGRPQAYKKAKDIKAGR